ncbi:MAG: hypothetical protein WC222_09840 [Parachlamydiales bacterium]
MSASITNPYNINYIGCVPGQTKETIKRADRKAARELVPSTNFISFLFNGLNSEFARNNFAPDQYRTPPKLDQTLPIKQSSFGVGKTKVVINEGKDLSTETYLIDYTVIIDTARNNFEGGIGRPEILCFWYNRNIQAFRTACFGAVLSLAGTAYGIASGAAVSTSLSIFIIPTATIILGIGIFILAKKRESQAKEQMLAWECPVHKEFAMRDKIRKEGFAAALHYPRILKPQFLEMFIEAAKIAKGLQADAYDISCLLNKPAFDTANYSPESHFVKFGFDPQFITTFINTIRHFDIKAEDAQTTLDGIVKTFLEEVENLRTSTNLP